MSLKKPENENYCANVVQINNITPLDNSDNIIHTSIYGNLVIVSKDTKVGDVGIYFPVECELSKEFLSNNNLYRDSTLNVDSEKKGYFETNGRIRAVKLRGNTSAGLFIPINCLNFTGHNEKLILGDCFDTINDVSICKKYVPKIKYIEGASNEKTRNKKKLKSIEIVDKQFNFHYSTAQLGKNCSRIKPEDIISITSKLHGCSSISSNILVKRKLSLLEKLLIRLGVKVQDTEYKNIFSSRKVIKNIVESKDKKSFYSEDIWGIANEEMKPYLQKGMTIYFEIVGYLPNGSYIQKGFDYGCKVGEHKNYVYRITQTNVDGVVHEFSAKEVQDLCKANGLNVVPELYYGKAIDLYNKILDKLEVKFDDTLDWNEQFLELLKLEYLEKDLTCNTSKKVPDEGIVLKIEGYEQEAYKLKSFKFYEFESKNLDSGETNIEDEV